MARTRRALLCTEAEITSDAIVEFQAQMATITTALQNLNVQRPPPPAHANVEQRDEDDEDDKANQFAAVEDNAFAPLRNNWSRDNDHEINDGYQRKTSFKTEIPEFHGNSSGEGLLDWIFMVEEILEFKRALMERCVLVLTMRFRGRTTAWWTQLKTTRAHS